MSRVWIVSELYYPEQNATGRILTAIAEDAAAHFEVGVLTAQPTYDARGTKAPKQETRNGVAIHRVSSSTLDKNVLPFRLVNMVTLSAAMYFAALRLFARGDTVLVVTNPPSLPGLILRACRAKGAKCAILVHDVYPEVLVRTGLSTPGSKIVRSTAKSSRELFESVDRIVALGRDMKALVEGKATQLRAPIEIIPNYADLEDVGPRPRSENGLLVELGIESEFVVQHAGNMGRTHGIEVAVEAARKLQDENVRFLFIGSGAKRKWLDAQMVENVTVLDFRPREALNDGLNACDVALISFIPGMAGISVPSRMYNVMAVGKPIIGVTDDDSELAQVIREEEIGWVVSPDDPEALALAVREAKADPERLRLMGERAREAAERKYSRPTFMARYKALFESMLTSE